MSDLRDHTKPCKDDAAFSVEVYGHPLAWYCREIDCPGGERVTDAVRLADGQPVVIVGGLTPAAYPAQDGDEPDGYLFPVQRVGGSR